MQKSTGRPLLPSSMERNVFAEALAANEALLRACQIFNQRDHRKKGGAIRFRNACLALIPLWEELTNAPFRKDVKTVKASDKLQAKRIKTEFANVEARFVFIAIYEIERRWVKVSQVQEGLKAALWEGNGVSSS